MSVPLLDLFANTRLVRISQMHLQNRLGGSGIEIAAKGVDQATKDGDGSVSCHSSWCTGRGASIQAKTFLRGAVADDVWVGLFRTHLIVKNSGNILHMKKSPFPGMDPYLERRWGDVHTSLCTEIRTALQPNLPAGLRARVQEDLPLQAEEDEDSAYYERDITVVETGDEGDESHAAHSGGLAVAIQPVAVRHIPRIKRRRWIEILDTSDSNRVVTAIEILSPGNKDSGALNKKYRQKIALFLQARANVVEIDLIRSSRRRLAVPNDEIPEDRRAAYYTRICRATDPTLWLVYPMSLRDPLPTIPIPCRPRDKDVPLELQPIIERIYLEGAHDDLKYNEELEPPLPAPDAAWVGQLINQRDRAGAK